MDTQHGNQEAKLKRPDLEDAIKTDIKIWNNDKGSEKTPTPETQFKPNYRDIVAMNLDTDPMNQNHLATKITKSRLGSLEMKGTGQNVVEKTEYKENIYKANNKEYI
jgi:hypothetical protein